eukprot:3020235-Pyramimonas_sp.AAC.1
MFGWDFKGHHHVVNDLGVGLSLLQSSPTQVWALGICRLRRGRPPLGGGPRGSFDLSPVRRAWSVGLGGLGFRIVVQ